MAAEHSFLKELREFLRFLRSLWGLLAGISTLFPLSNAFIQLIPIAGTGRPLRNLDPAGVSAVTVLTCVFLTFAAVGQRASFQEPARRARYAGWARLSFGIALALLAVYVLGPNGFQRLLLTGSGGELNVALYDGLFAALYVATFALLTRAFLLLALLEYVHVPAADVP